MNFKYSWQEIKNNKLSSIILVLVVGITTFLFIAGSITASRLGKSIQQMMEMSQTPDYLFMHTGNIDLEELTQFAQNDADVDAFLVQDFINIDASKIFINNQPLSGNVQDNGFVVQNHAFDYLLDLNNQIIDVNDGEVYVPLAYYQPSLKIGDEIKVNNIKFKFKGYLRDSQMNSPLASSKRWLVSENDIQKIKAFGDKEYLIEFQLKPSADFAAFESRYQQASLPVNGPTITRQLFILINAMTDGIVILIVFIIGILLLVITYIAFRLTLKTQLETDYYTMGVLKAIGLRNSDLKSMYLCKYGILTGLGTIVGAVFSMYGAQIVSGNLERTMGSNRNIALEWLSVLIMIVIMNGIVYLWTKRILSKIAEVSPLQALRQEKVDAKSKIKPLKMLDFKWLRPNVSLIWQEMIQEKRLYILVIIMTILSVVIMILPIHLYSTLNSPKFINYMGLGDYQVIATVPPAVSDEANITKIKEQIQKDQQIEESQILIYKKLKMDDEQILTQIGNHQLFPVNYAEGSYPRQTNEIALSALAAAEREIALGDSVNIGNGDYQQEFRVVGLYSDITNGGRTAKVIQSVDYEPITSVQIGLRLKSMDNVSTEKWINTWTKAYPKMKIHNVQSFLNETYGSTIIAIKNVMMLAQLVGVSLILLIIGLFFQNLYAKYREQQIQLLLLGFRKQDLIIQAVLRLVIICGLAIPIGIDIATRLGQKVIAMILSQLGTIGFKFVINWPIVVGILPIILITLIIIVMAYILNRTMRQWLLQLRRGL